MEPTTSTKIQLNDGTNRWFNPTKCRVYEESTWPDLNGEKISTATNSKFYHQQLYETPGGRFILRHYYDFPHPEMYEEISIGRAMSWLAQNGINPPQELAKHFESTEVL